MYFHGAIAQLGERNTGSVEVRGSIPLGSTKNKFFFIVYLQLLIKEYENLLGISIFFLHVTQERNDCELLTVFTLEFFSSQRDLG